MSSGCSVIRTDSPMPYFAFPSVDAPPSSSPPRNSSSSSFSVMRPLSFFLPPRPRWPGSSAVKPKCLNRSDCPKRNRRRASADAVLSSSITLFCLSRAFSASVRSRTVFGFLGSAARSSTASCSCARFSARSISRADGPPWLRRSFSAAISFSSFLSYTACSFVWRTLSASACASKGARAEAFAPCHFAPSAFIASAAPAPSPKSRVTSARVAAQKKWYAERDFFGGSSSSSITSADTPVSSAMALTAMLSLSIPRIFSRSANVSSGSESSSFMAGGSWRCLVLFVPRPRSTAQRSQP
mmetsp:Transcript_13378/g.31386  ORF Transcript_13378/g.31386 Transcript_13378/m.31386 type:complete len:298 (-) Transcript_13378:5-898(-)